MKEWIYSSNRYDAYRYENKVCIFQAYTNRQTFPKTAVFSYNYKYHELFIKICGEYFECMEKATNAVDDFLLKNDRYKKLYGLL